MRILVVEDDTLQADFVLNSLRRAFPADQIDLIRTESEFRYKFEFVSESDVIVLDVMLPWCEPEPDMTAPPPEVLREGHFRAGFRCQRLLAHDEKTKNIPVIIYTVLEKTDLHNCLEENSPSPIYLSKDDDHEPLIALIRQTTRRF